MFKIQFTVLITIIYRNHLFYLCSLAKNIKVIPVQNKNNKVPETLTILKDKKQLLSV